MNVYQVLNKEGCPASNDFDDLCIFPTEEKAQDWIDDVIDCDSSLQEKDFHIKLIHCSYKPLERSRNVLRDSLAAYFNNFNKILAHTAEQEILEVIDRHHKEAPDCEEQEKETILKIVDWTA